MPSPDPEHYLAVLKASYDYEPQSSDEIAIKEDQLLFLVERTDDDWWKVKVKGDSQDADTPADHKHLVKALYDYEAAAPGELTISEDEILLAFEVDEEWLLVQSQKESGGAGYVPGNYVEETTGEEPPPAPKIIIPPSNPRPVSTYVDPADRVAASKVTADDIKNVTPVQKWQTGDITDISNAKAKHVGIEIGGANPVSLLFNVGKDNVEAIMKKLQSSRDLAKPPVRDAPSPEPSSSQYVAPPPQKTPEKGTVRFSPASPTIIPPREEEEEEEEEEQEEEHHPTPNGHTQPPPAGHGEQAIALYDFSADGEDELSVVENEELLVIERDGDEWWKCRNAHGAEGVVPASYIELKDGSSVPASRAQPQPEEEEEPADDGAAEAERLAQEAADREEAERLQREEEERAAKERKKIEAQRRAKEAAAAAEAERVKRREAAAAAAKKSPPPAERPEREARSSNSSSARKSQEVTFPPAEHVRTWHDRSGQFRVEAAFVGFNGGKLRLHKINGVIVEVPTEKMSTDDMKFIEKLTRKSRGSSSAPPTRPSDDDIPLATLQKSTSSPKARPSTSGQPQKPKGPRIDWFDFFLSAGCDIDDCTRYTSAFDRDKIDESLLPDITDSTMRSLGLREGDIIRVRKAIEKRRPGENLEKESRYVKEQMKRDEELAKQLQAQETGGGSRSPAPDLFAGAGGVLKHQPRRGRKETSKTLPINVDKGALSAASEQINRTSSPLTTSPVTRPGSAPIQPAKTNSAPVATANGFDDEAWAPRPASAKPTVAASPKPPASAPAVPISAPSPPAAPSSAPPVATTAPAPAPTALASVAPPVQATGTPTKNLANATHNNLNKPATPNVVSPPSFSAGLGMGNSQLPVGQALSAHQSGMMQSSTPQPPPPQQPSQQPYNGPRGPYAPVPANQGLLQPLIPTQTGFNSFIPTRANSVPSPAPPMPNQFNSTPSLMASQPTGMPGGMGFQQQQPQPLLGQPTGMPVNGFSASPFGSGSVMNASPFGSGSSFQPNTNVFNPNPSPLTVQPTGVFAQSPFNLPASPPPVPSNSGANSTAPANVFASMKSGTFGKDEDLSGPQSADKYSALRPNLAPQPTGWNGYNGYSGF
ncbi:hypothetical protein NP233_g3768 [Leucocoprinus birnbaumii]|uniref:Actin cytoskeleton-regulatory complex protein SLA1 n=1 Tax=Leucocoprinus birnbaumii TaxID=56174 RepID=A0AAD5VWF5_9AGAR|nr:hypothetical protein NP233_g3768 [Leucocoprinus birnbaumii]